MAEEAVLAKEWDEDGECWWWFGRRIALSDLCAGKERFPQFLRRRQNPSNGKTDPPKRLLYEGRLYRLGLITDPPRDLGPEAVPLLVWEFTDADQIESVLIESSPEGETIAYHGAYYDPETITF